MARMSGNERGSIRNFGDSLQLNNWVLDSGAMCHITPQVSDFIPGLLEDTDKYIEVAEKGQIQIRMRDNNGYPFITKFHNVLLAPDLCNILF